MYPNNNNILYCKWKHNNQINNDINDNMTNIQITQSTNKTTKNSTLDEHTSGLFPTKSDQDTSNLNDKFVINTKTDEQINEISNDNNQGKISLFNCNPFPCFF